MWVWSLLSIALASSGLDGHIKIWDIETGTFIKNIDGGPSNVHTPSIPIPPPPLHLVDVWTIVHTPDGRYLATGSHGGKINLYEVDTGTKFTSFDTRGKFTLSVACVRKTMIMIIMCYWYYY